MSRRSRRALVAAMSVTVLLSCAAAVGAQPFYGFNAVQGRCSAGDWVPVERPTSCRLDRMEPAKYALGRERSSVYRMRLQWNIVEAHRAGRWANPWAEYNQGLAWAAERGVKVLLIPTLTTAGFDVRGDMGLPRRSERADALADVHPGTRGEVRQRQPRDRRRAVERAERLDRVHRRRHRHAAEVRGARVLGDQRPQGCGGGRRDAPADRRRIDRLQHLRRRRRLHAQPGRLHERVDESGRRGTPDAGLSEQVLRHDRRLRRRERPCLRLAAGQLARGGEDGREHVRARQPGRRSEQSERLPPSRAVRRAGARLPQPPGDAGRLHQAALR